MALKNMGTSTVRFKQGVFVEGQDIHGDANQLVVTGSISLMGLGAQSTISANPTNTEAMDGNNWYYLPGDGSAPNNTSYQPRIPLSSIPIDGGGSWSDEIYTFFGTPPNDIRMFSHKQGLTGTVTISFLIIGGGDVGSGGTTNDIKLADEPTATSNSHGTLGAPNKHDFTGGSSDPYFPVKLMYSTDGFTYQSTWVQYNSLEYHAHYGSHPNAGSANITNAAFTRVNVTVSGISGTYYLGLVQDITSDHNWNAWAIADLSISEGGLSYINFEPEGTWYEGEEGIGFRNNAGIMEYKDEGFDWKQFSSLAVGPQAPDRAIQFNNQGELGSGNFFYGSNANVGIGDFSAADSDFLLHIKGNSGYSGNEGELTISDRSTTNYPGMNFIREQGDGGLIQAVSDGDEFGRISFLGRNASGTNTEGARIESHAFVDGTDIGGELAFQVKTPTGTLENKMVIKNDGVITLPDGRNVIDSTNENNGSPPPIVLNQKLQLRVNGTEVGAVSSDGIQADVLFSKGTLGTVAVVGQNASSLSLNDVRTECFQYSATSFNPHSDFITDNLSTQTLGLSTSVWNTAYVNTVQNVTGSSMEVKSDESMTLQINQTGDNQRWGTTGGSGSPVEFKIQANYATSFGAGSENPILGTTPRDVFSFQSTGTTGANGTVSIGSSLLYLDSGIYFYGDNHEIYANSILDGPSSKFDKNTYVGGSYMEANSGGFYEEKVYLGHRDTSGTSTNEQVWLERLETQEATGPLGGNAQTTKRFGHAHNGNFQETFRMGSGGAFIFGDAGVTTGFDGDVYGRAHLGFVPYNSAVSSGLALMDICVYDEANIVTSQIRDFSQNAYLPGNSDDYVATFRMRVKPQSGYVSGDASNMGNSFHIQMNQDGQSTIQEPFTIDSGGHIGLGDSTPSQTHKVSIGGDLIVDGSVEAQGFMFNNWYNESSSSPTGVLIKFDDSEDDLVLNPSHNFDTVIMGGTASNEIFKVDNESENVYMRGTVFIGNHTDVDVSGSIGTGITAESQGCVPSPGGLYAPTELKHKSGAGWPFSTSSWNTRGPVLYVESVTGGHTTIDGSVDPFIATFVNPRNHNDTDGIQIILGKGQNQHNNAYSLTSPAETNRYIGFFSPTMNYDPTDNDGDTLGSNTFWLGITDVGSISGDGSGGVRTNGISFTGTHDACSSETIEQGMIVESTGEMWISNGMNTSLPYIVQTSEGKSKTVYGVVESNEIRSGRSNSVRDKKGYTVNALGEGKVWVTTISGEPTNGDYITSSPIRGYGQLQDDDILHSYTVAKLTESIDWSSITETINHEGSSYKKYLAGCTYHCG